MTVSTVVAAYCRSCGATASARRDEAARDAVLGGMVSSLIYVLIVTPVLFY